MGFKLKKIAKDITSLTINDIKDSFKDKNLIQINISTNIKTNLDEFNK